MRVFWQEKEYLLKLTKHIPQNDERQRSDLHLKTRQILQTEFPFDKILEEIYLPGVNLYCDFFIPSRMIVVEAHGQQHYEFVKHFHQTQYDFLMSKKRDSLKEEFCRENNIRYITINDRTDENEFRCELRGKAGS